MDERLCLHRRRHDPKICNGPLQRCRCAIPKMRRGLPRRIQRFLGRCLALWLRSRCLGTFPCCLGNSGNMSCLLTLPFLPRNILTVALRDGLEPRALLCQSPLGNAIVLLCLAWTTTASHPAPWRIKQLDRATDQGSLNAPGAVYLSFERCKYAYIHNACVCLTRTDLTILH